MRELPRAAAVYILAVVAAGTAVLLLAAAQLPRGGALLAEVALFAALAALADLRQLKLSYNATCSVATAINLASVVVFGADVATWVSAAGSLSGDLWKQKPAYKVAFNVGVISMSVAAGGHAFAAVRGTPTGAVSPHDWPAFAAYVAVNLLVNQVLLCTVLALVTRTRLRDVVAANYHGVFVQMFALFPVGVLMAVAYVHFGKALGLVLLAVPTLAVYDALNKAQQLRDHTRATLEALADAVDRRDAYTAEHSRRVADYAGRIAAVLGLSYAERETLISAARVHDLGKISTPDSVLLKAGGLTDEEWRLMRQHPQVGAEILEKLPMYRAGARLVGYHHERPDGAGYPHSIGGDDLPLGARILAVADAFDAMTSDRPYRRALPVPVALARLRAGAGTQFCPRVVEAFARALEAPQESEAPQGVVPQRAGA